MLNMKGERMRIVAVDCGIKARAPPARPPRPPAARPVPAHSRAIRRPRATFATAANIIRYFMTGVELLLVPWDYDLEGEGDGLFISNGPTTPPMRGDGGC